MNTIFLPLLYLHSHIKDIKQSNYYCILISFLAILYSVYDLLGLSNISNAYMNHSLILNSSVLIFWISIFIKSIMNSKKNKIKQFDWLSLFFLHIPFIKNETISVAILLILSFYFFNFSLSYSKRKNEFFYFIIYLWVSIKWIAFENLYITNVLNFVLLYVFIINFIKFNNLKNYSLIISLLLILINQLNLTNSYNLIFIISLAVFIITWIVNFLGYYQVAVNKLESNYNIRLLLAKMNIVLLSNKDQEPKRFNTNRKVSHQFLNKDIIQIYTENDLRLNLLTIFILLNIFVIALIFGYYL